MKICKALVTDITAALYTELSNISKQVEATAAQVCILDHTVQSHEDRISHMEMAQSQLFDKFAQFHLKMEDVENCNRRNNLKLSGLPRATGDHDLLSVVTAIFNKILDKSPDNHIEIGRVHRVPNLGGFDPRDVMCRIHLFQFK